jgi:hypothetical protein
MQHSITLEERGKCKELGSWACVHVGVDIAVRVMKSGIEPGNSINPPSSSSLTSMTSGSRPSLLSTRVML